MKFIRSSRYIRKACGGSYVIGQRCLRYEIVGVDSLPDAIEDSAHPKSEVLSGGYWTGPVTWRMVDFRPLMEAIQDARLQMGWEKSKLDAEWSLSQLDEPTVTEDKVVENCESDVQADAHVPSKGLPSDHASMDVAHAEQTNRTHSAILTSPDVCQRYGSVTSRSSWWLSGSPSITS